MEEEDRRYISELQCELREMKAIDEDYLIRNDCLSLYDVIGFDVDHTLSIYDHGNMLKVLWESFTKYLIDNKGYPASEYDYENNEEFIVQMAKCEILLDFTSGNAIQFDCGKRIIKAYHGMKVMTDEEIGLQYPNGIYEGFELGMHYKENVYYYAKNNFELHQIPIYLLGVELFDKKKLPLTVESYAKIFKDIYEGLIFNFQMTDPHQDCKNVGYFFPMFTKEPNKYFCKEYNSRELIKKLREKGKKVFFTTNSYFSFADIVLRNSIGDDYAELFDLCIFNGKKPSFFKENLNPNEQSCLFYDKTIINEMNDEVFDKIHTRKENIILGGSYKIVEAFFNKLIKKDKANADQVKYLFVGDDLYGDCMLPAKLNNWSSLYIFDTIKTGKIKNEPEKFRNGWLDNENDKKDIKSDTLKANSILILSNVAGIAHLIK